MSEPIQWTPGSLRLLRRNARRGYTLKHLSARMGVSPSDCDLALWTLIGRTPGAAALVLNKRAAA